MDLHPLAEKDKQAYNSLVTHVIQSWEWGEFRKKLGLPLLRYGIYKKGKLYIAFQLTLHKIPFSSQYVGYLPKGPLPDKEMAQALEEIGRIHNCAFIKVEPNVLVTGPFSVYPKFQSSPKPMFTKYNFLIDLNLSEEELLQNMHPKTRYNIKLAQKKGVKIETESDDKSFEKYIKLHFETALRQGFHSHNYKYHKLNWEVLKKSNMAQIVMGYYKGKLLSAWMLSNFKDTIYYQYGGSSSEYKEVMANNLVAWEAIRLGKKMNLKTFDMWGAANTPDPDRNNPYFGFHNFKKGYGGKLVEYLGTYDLVFNDPLYWLVTSIDKFTSLKVFLLKLLGK
ncbi:peptidoglycan bridge formation glycyltransferase FemA/FemB family protein [Candidatus Daviesbacteria bacterium]|nr:peptidoglycan bridge formation glycyltransferase FemA/FemB family protein [Candidatus Daviesbacteria bacterium]